MTFKVDLWLPCAHAPKCALTYMNTHAYACIWTHAHACSHTCSHAWTHAHATHMHSHAWTHVHMCVSMHEHMYIAHNVHVCVHIHEHMYTHAYTPTHKLKLKSHRGALQCVFGDKDINWKQFTVTLQETRLQGWWDGSVVKSSDYSSRGPRFKSQHPHGSSQLSVTPVPENLTSLYQCV